MRSQMNERVFQDHDRGTIQRIRILDADSNSIQLLQNSANSFLCCHMNVFKNSFIPIPPQIVLNNSKHIING